MLKKYDWLFAILRVNWANMTAHKGSFYSLMLLMCVQNFIYFYMWVIIFAKVKTLNGWGLSDVAFLYASGAMGYGVLVAVFGGLNQLGPTIQSGDMDLYLARPRSPLLLAMMQRMRADSVGDVLCGFIMLGLFVQPPVNTWPLLLLLSLSAGLVYVGFRLICHCLVFWGSQGELGENAYMSFMIASLNPQNGFSPMVKCVLLTIFPAGYVGLLPVEIMRDFDWRLLTLQLVGSCGVMAFALWLWQYGLRRYASGNLFTQLR